MQDKICDALTFVGLCAVIGWGAFALWPKAAAVPVQENTAEEQLEETTSQETMEELPALEETSQLEENGTDAIPADTSLLLESSSEPIDTFATSRPSTENPAVGKSPSSQTGTGKDKAESKEEKPASTSALQNEKKEAEEEHSK